MRRLVTVLRTAVGNTPAFERFRGRQIDAAMGTANHRFALCELFGRPVAITRAFGPILSIGTGGCFTISLLSPSRLFALSNLYELPDEVAERQDR